MRRIFLLVMSVFVSVCISAQRWTNGVTKGDKVEQKPSSDYWLYEDENTSFFYIVNDVTFILELPNDKVRLINSQNGQGTPVTACFGIIATFDKDQNRTNYWKDVIFIKSETDNTLICSELAQLEENKNAIYEMWKWLKEKSGSIVIRLNGVEKYYIDTEIRTIKTLGYEDKNGRHWDGDIDVIGVR